MRLNVGTWDRVLRVILGAVIVVLLVTGVLNLATGLGIAAAIAAGILIVTGSVSFCPAYSLFGIGTRADKT